MTQEQETSLRQTIIGWVQAELDGGAEGSDAYVTVRDRIKLDGLIQEAFEAFGATWVSQLYRLYAHSHRTAARQGFVRWLQPGQRKVIASQVNAVGNRLFGITEEVDGTWKAFGDCTAEDCDWLAKDRATLADENARAGKVYAAFARAIRRAKAKTVRQAFQGRIQAALALYRRMAETEDKS